MRRITETHVAVTIQYDTIRCSLRSKADEMGSLI